MNSKSVTIVVATILVLLIIFILISYSYYPSSNDNSTHVLIDAQLAQAIASKKRKEVVEMGTTERNSLWNEWSEEMEKKKN